MRRILSRIWATLKSREFWIGYSQAFNLFPFPEDYRGYPHKSVEDALRSDWEAVGGDMWKAIDEFERAKGKEQP